METKRRIELPPPKPLEKEKVEESSENVTHRFSLSLQLPTDDSCSEFSYIKLLKDAKSHEVLSKKDPFASVDKAEDDKLTAIAKEFEEKYGNKSFAEEYIDLGDGYDTNDSFIDNAEAYDELVPSCLTTKLGGFYINAGVLDFKEIAEKTPKKKKKKKSLVICSDSESTSDFKKKGPKVKHGEIKTKKRKRSLEDITKKAKKTKNKGTASKSKEKNNTSKKSVSELVHGNSLAKQSLSQGTNGNDLAAIDSAIDAVVKNSMLLDADSLEDSQDNSDIANKVPPNLDSIPKLPENLSAQVLQNIETVKRAAMVSTSAKSKFFTPAINKTLLEIEKQSRQVSCMQRSSIYSHMTAFLPCGKETLLKRIKKLLQNELDDKLKEPLQALKDAIVQEMPKQIDKHVQETLLFAQQHQGKATDVAGKEADAITSQTESDDEEKKTNLEEPEKDESSKKKPRGPPKKFEWTDQIRSLTCRVVTLKMNSFELAKNKGQTAEDYIKAFLEAEVRPLWPKGWMQTRTLFKETRLAHFKWTNPASSKLKKVAIENRTLSATNVPSQSSLTSAAQTMVSNKIVKPPAKQNVTVPLKKVDPFATLLDYAEGKSSAETEALENMIRATSEVHNLANDGNKNENQKPKQPAANAWEAEFNKYALSSGAKSGPTTSNNVTTVNRSHNDSSQSQGQSNMTSVLKTAEATPSVSQGLSSHASDLLKRKVSQEQPKSFQPVVRKQPEPLRTSTVTTFHPMHAHNSKEKNAWASSHQPSLGVSKTMQSVPSSLSQNEAMLRTKSMLSFQTGQSLLKPGAGLHSHHLQKGSKPAKPQSDPVTASQPDITGLSLGQIQQLMYSTKSPGASSHPKEFFSDVPGWGEDVKRYAQYMHPKSPGYHEGGHLVSPVAQSRAMSTMHAKRSPGYHEGPTTPPTNQTGALMPSHSRKSPGFVEGHGTSPGTYSSPHLRRSPENPVGYPWNAMSSSSTSPRAAPHVTHETLSNLMNQGMSDVFRRTDMPENAIRQYPPYPSKQ